MFERILPLFGIAAMILIALAFSTDRRAALRRWDLIAWGFGLQFVFALLVLRTQLGQDFFEWFNDVFVALTNVTLAGSNFLFGPLMDVPSTGYVFAFQVLPTIILFSALTAILYHMGVMQAIVKAFAWLMHKTLKTSGAETLSASANIFVGQTEAPLMVKPFIGRMTRSELTTIMTGGFATVAGGVMAAYIGMLKDTVPGIAGHLLAASIMSAPAGLVFGKLFVPETEVPETADNLHVQAECESANLFDAATIGTRDGLSLALNVGAMLLAFLALIALADGLLGFVGPWLFRTEIAPAWWNLRGIVGYLFAPLAWLMGVSDWGEAVTVGQLMGIKMVANEFVAYADLSAMLAAAGQSVGTLGDVTGAAANAAASTVPVLSQRASIIAVYALCGFANFGSIGIQIGGLAIMAPERRVDLSRVALRAMFAGTFACNATACIAAILL